MYNVGDIVIINEKVVRDLPTRIGQRAFILGKYYTTDNYDYYVEFDDGSKSPVKIDELNKLNEEDKQFMNYIFTNNQVMFDDKKVVISKVNYLTQQADIFDEIGVFSIVEFKDLEPVHIDSLEEMLKHDSRSDKHRKVIEEIHKTFNIKNADYGNSFGEQFDEYGILSAVIRLDDKMRRLKQLMNQPAQVKDESIRDTVLDMANYAIMTVMELDNK